MQQFNEAVSGERSITTPSSRNRWLALLTASPRKGRKERTMIVRMDMTDEEYEKAIEEIVASGRGLEAIKTISKALKELPSDEAEDRHYIKIYADDEPSVKAEKLYQICGETQNREVAEWLKEYFPSTNDNWIPVSERLPKQTDEYIVSVHYSRDSVWTDKFGYTPTTDGGWYDPEDTKQNMVDWNKYILAWMPLPTPYKGGDTE